MRVLLYRSTFSWPRHYLMVNGQLHTPAALPTELNPRYPLNKKLGGLQSPYGRRGEEKILDPTGTWNSDHSVIQPVTSRYTDYVIPAPYSENRRKRNLWTNCMVHIVTTIIWRAKSCAFSRFISFDRLLSWVLLGWERDNSVSTERFNADQFSSNGNDFGLYMRRHQFKSQLNTDYSD
jgi:hypothetical protein